MPVPCHLEQFSDYATTLPRLLDGIGAPEILARQTRIIIKPNLVNDSPHPVTTSPACVAALVRYLRRHTEARLIIAEGSGDRMLSTIQVFNRHGFFALAEEYDLKLIDLNQAPLVMLERPGLRIFPEFWIPGLIMEGFLISLANLKAHSLADVTLCMKNMIGCAPPSHYQGGGHWKKSAFHRRIHQSIFELNRHRAPDLAIIDASVGLAEHHLGGPACHPAPNRLVAGFDPVAVDAAGAELLKRPWQEVEHIRLADGVLGDASAGVNAVLLSSQPPSGAVH